VSQCSLIGTRANGEIRSDGNQKVGQSKIHVDRLGKDWELPIGPSRPLVPGKGEPCSTLD
jgi:hypothetical protein